MIANGSPSATHIADFLSILHFLVGGDSDERTGNVQGLRAPVFKPDIVTVYAVCAYHGAACGGKNWSAVERCNTASCVAADFSSDGVARCPKGEVMFLAMSSGYCRLPLCVMIGPNCLRQSRTAMTAILPVGRSSGIPTEYLPAFYVLHSCIFFAYFFAFTHDL